MKVLGRNLRSLAITCLAFIPLVSAIPAQAGPQDVALLKSYVGEWRGRGTIVGDQQETVVCQLSLREGNEDKVNYSGRCAIAGSTLSINGTLAFVDALQRYEAAMTSNVAFSGIAVGQKRGNGVTFNLREREQSEGQPVTITSQIVLNNGAINVDFQVVYEESGDTLRASVPFSK
ncbi:hypothetical protein GCM10007989_01800 [Devosia pacifica]|uniref:THAP4-like heme-binding beta-barrel domain-containing protein n=1 Tax=Devosia pacifica TaxID=1335967 RepID=A0A918RU38_9HYPH|nr:hypothetical protein [Devosia pacifica]GHA11131.1 hypothetical protein GCM10007989_01800 [Devosia pacifica]